MYTDRTKFFLIGETLRPISALQSIDFDVINLTVEMKFTDQTAYSFNVPNSYDYMHFITGFTDGININNNSIFYVDSLITMIQQKQD